MTTGQSFRMEDNVPTLSATPGFQPNNGMLMRPDHLPPSAWSGHIPFGAWLVAALHPRLLVELGTHHGASYLAFCQAVREHGLDTRCLAVDTWEGDDHAGAYGDEVYDTLRKYHDPLYATFSELLRMTFDDALGSVADGSVDLLHIDGLHTYDAVSHDFHGWRPKLSRRAVVLFHDTQVRDRDFGVWRFWDEVRASHPSFEFPHSHGLGVLLVGAEVPAGIRALACLDAAQRAHVQRLFERLGEGIVARGQAEELGAALTGREQGVALYREHATALEAKVATLQAERGRIEHERDAIQRHYDVLLRDITHLEQRIASLQHEVASRDAGLDVYRTQAQALEQRVATLANESAAAHAALDEARAALQAAHQRHAEMTDALMRRHADATDALARHHADAIDSLMQRLDAANARLDTVLHSRSWRATAWMRKLSSIVRGSA